MKPTIRTFAAAAIFTTAALFPSLAHAGNLYIAAASDSVTISGNDYEHGLSANGQNIDTNYGGAALTVSLGTPINFSGGITDFGGTTAGTQQIYVLPFAGASYAISDLNFSNSNSNGTFYTVSGTYNSLENIAVPNGATTIVAGDSTSFNSRFSANTLSTTAVPEPTSMALLGLGAVAAWLTLRRQHMARA